MEKRAPIEPGRTPPAVAADGTKCASLEQHFTKQAADVAKEVLQRKQNPSK